MSTREKTYADQEAWRDLQEFLPVRLRLSEANQMPTEGFWTWNTHQIHLDRYPNPEAPARVLLHHGVGTNGRQMTLILGRTLAERGWDVSSIDNLGYGMTKVAEGANYTYEDWVNMVLDYLAYMKSEDGRPIVLYGLSAGGMLTYHVAAAAPEGTLAGNVGITFLDQRLTQVRRDTAHDPLTALIGPGVMRLLSKTRLGDIKIPMTLASKMSALANNPGAMKVFLKDKTSAANAVPIRFLDSYLSYQPAVEPKEFAACPVLLTQPAEDRWSPLQLSKPVLDAITKVPVETVLLDGAGHFPLEQPGLTQMQDAIDEFIRTATKVR